MSVHLHGRRIVVHSYVTRNFMNHDERNAWHYTVTTITYAVYWHRSLSTSQRVCN